MESRPGKTREDEVEPISSIRWLTVPDFVARHRGLIGRSSVYGAIREGKLPHVRLGRRLLIPADALERLLQGEGRKEPAKA